MAFDVDEHFIAATEEALGCKLPKALRARLAVCNGGKVLTANEDWLLFPVPDTSSKKRLIRTFNDMIKETASARQWPHFPTDAIAVASNGCGDLLIACHRLRWRCGHESVKPIMVVATPYLGEIP
jgi:hypothetical protein